MNTSSATKYLSHKNNLNIQPEKAKVKSEGWEYFKIHWQMYLILLLPILYILIFCYGPMYGILIGFKRYSPSKGIMGSPLVGFYYFKQFFSSPSSWNIILNTFVLSLYSIIASFPFPIMLAIALNETKNKVFKKTVQMVTYIPYFISTVVLVGMMFQFTDIRIGFINKFIELLGGDTINFMGKPELFRHMYAWSGVWQTTGYSCIIYLAALSGVNTELQEAAVIDGATIPQRIWHVDIPCIKPTILILLILSLGNTMNVGFEKVYLMQNSLNLSSSEIISTYVYKVGLVSADFSYSTAIGLFNSVVNLILMITVNFITKKIGGSSLW